ncbi:MAG: RDD family protein [Saprospiraceae bacterium]|nr:RDD family protein [Saprospiraceae bacterium]
MKTIEIRTTQNVIIEYELANAWTRLSAFLIDVLIVLGIYLVFNIMVAIAFPPERGASTDTEIADRWAVIIGRFLPIYLFLGYMFFSELLMGGQTWGKKGVGIRVLSLDGREPGVIDYLLRTVFYLADVFTSAGVIGLLFISASAKGQRLGDMAANTAVVKINPKLQFQLKDILRIDSTGNYTPVFPQVRQLSEQDMLLVKNALIRYREFPNEAHSKALSEMILRLMTLLEIAEFPRDRENFLKTLIRDYIVLTR